MIKKIIIAAHFLLILDSGVCQEHEKLLDNQSLLIDAIREESIGNRDKAILILEKLKFEPDTKAVSNYYLARIYESLNRKEDAIQAIEACVIAEPDNKWYLLLKAKMTEDLGQYLTTAMVYQQLINLEPSVYSHYDNAAINYLKVGNTSSALLVLHLAQNKFGLLPTIALKKSRILVGTNKFKKAIELLENCLAKNKGQKEILEELVIISRDQNNKSLISKYEALLKQADSTNSLLLKQNTKLPDSDELNLNSIIESKQHSLDEKIKFLIIKIDQNLNAHDKNGIQSLIPYADKLVKQAPHDSKTHTLKGDLHFQLDEFIYAKDAYIQAVESGNVPYTVWENLLFCLTQLGHWNASEYYSGVCMELYPAQSFPFYVNLLSKFNLKKLKDIENSLQILESMVQFNPKRKMEALILKARVYSEMQQPDATETSWKEALKIQPSDIAALYYNSYLVSQNKIISSDAIASLANSENIDKLLKYFKLAEIYFIQKDYKQSKEMIEKGFSFGISYNSEYYLLASKIYAAINDPDKSNIYKMKSTELSEQNTIYPYKTREPK